MFCDTGLDTLDTPGKTRQNLFEKAGVAAAKRRGKRRGRPQAISDEQLTAIQAALDGGASKAAICRTFGVKRTTLYDALARAVEPTVLRGTGGA